MLIPPPPRSTRLAGCMWLERIVYKVRMNAAGILLEEYRHSLGAKSGVDGAFLNHFFLTLANIEAIALLPDDEAAAAFLRFPGVTPEKIAFWNEIAPNLGLKGFPMEGRVSMALSGPYKHLKDKSGLETVFDVLEADEGLRQ